MSSIKIVECPRDAMQGIKQWIPSEIKLDYLQSVLSVGFDVVDFGSFVSKRAIPQMSDSAYIIDQLDLSNTTSKLLAIVANERGAFEACSHSSLSYLGFPFSISEIFQMRNTNKSISESFEELKKIKTISEKYSKNLVVYLSMGFGNPYGEPWSYEIVEKWIDKLSDLKIQVISLSDTIGTAVPDDIFNIFSNMNITPKSISYSGNLKGKDSLEFISYDYDLLINFFKSNNVLTLLSSKVNAKFRVGFSSVDSRLNDLIFSEKIKKFKEFDSELIKYLRIIK